MCRDCGLGICRHLPPMCWHVLVNGRCVIPHWSPVVRPTAVISELGLIVLNVWWPCVAHVSCIVLSSSPSHASPWVWHCVCPRLPRGKCWIACRTIGSHIPSASPGMMPGSMHCGISPSAGGSELGCRSRSLAHTKGSEGSCVPCEARTCRAFLGAPSETSCSTLRTTPGCSVAEKVLRLLACLVVVPLV